MKITADAAAPQPPAMPVHLRRLTAEDTMAYRVLMLHAYEHAADAFTSTPEERSAQSETWWARRIADPGGSGVGFGAFRGDAMVGTVALEFAAKTKTRHKVEVVGMFVAPACRRLGIGKALVEAAVAHARSRAGLRVMTLTATQGNGSAVRLYESCGFRTFGIEPMAILTPTGLKGKVHMWLGLGPAISTIEPSEADAVRDLMARAIHPVLQHDEAVLRDTIANVNGNLDLWLAQPDRCVHLKASVGEALAGVILVKDGWNLCSLFVDPEHQGRGIGRALVDAARVACAGASDELLLNAAGHAVAFYAKLGFVPRTSNQRLPPDVVPMRLALS